MAQAAKIESKRKAEESKAKKGTAVGAPSAAARLQEQRIEISEFENDPPVGTPPLFDAQANPVMPQPLEETGQPPRVMLRVLHMRDVLDNLMSSLTEKQRETLNRVLTGLKVAEFPKAASRAVCGAYLTLIKEALEYIDLRKSIEAKQLVKKRIKPEDGTDSMDLDHAWKRLKTGM